MNKIVINNIKTIQIESPVDKIISQLKQLILTGELKPGDRLPSERALSEMFGVGRSYIREAILKLEFYGLLKTNPQSGTYVAGLSISLMDNIITDIINFNKDDFNSLIETRFHLELTSAKLAAERRSNEELLAIKRAAESFENKVNLGKSAVEEDMLFHIQIAKASKNPVLESMILILIPDLIKNIIDNNVCGDNRSKLSIPQHMKVIKAIEVKDEKIAEKAMAEHLNDLLQVSKAGFAANKIISQNKEE